MRRTSYLAAGLALVLAALTGCGNKDRGGTPSPTVVTISKPIYRDVTDYKDFTGRTEAVDKVDVKPKVWGYIDKVLYQEGTEVHKGQVLYQIDPRPYQADLDKALSQVRLAEAQVRFTQADYARYQRLAAQGSASQEDVDKARRSLDVAKAQVEAEKAGAEQKRLDLNFTRVIAPISGLISRTQVTDGNLVLSSSGNATLLTNIVSLDPVYVYFNVDERTVLEIRQMMREDRFTSPRDKTRNEAFSHASVLGSLLSPAGAGPLLGASVLFPGRSFILVPVWVGLATEKGHPHKGYVDFVDNKVDTSTGTLQVRAVFFNEKRVLAPGLFVRVRVPVGGEHKALLVTERALGTDQGQKFVYVVNANKEVESRPVELGALHDGLREITAGLEPDEQVIINGVMRVRPGVTVNPKPGKMAGPGAEAGERKPSGNGR